MSFVIRYFDKKDESYRGEVALPMATLQLMQEIFQISTNDSMYGCFPIKDEHVQPFKKLMDISSLVESFDCFLEFDAD